MITKLRGEQQEADSTPTEDREAFVAVFNPESGEWIQYHGDGVAEIITLPGGMVQAIDMTGERHDSFSGSIVMVTGTSWSVWTKRGDETTRHDDVMHVQKNPNGEVVLIDEHTQLVGTEIRRAKRTSILQSE